MSDEIQHQVVGRARPRSTVDEEGNVAFEGLPSPPPHPKRERAWISRDPDAPGKVWIHNPNLDPESRDFEDIMLRSVPRAVAYRFRGAAGARGLTHAQYLAALVRVHELVRERADNGNAELAAVLQELGLSTVSI